MKLWRDLAPSTKERYKRQGVTPSSYNAWNRKTPAARKALLSKFPGAKSGPQAVHESNARRRERAAAKKLSLVQRIINAVTPRSTLIENARENILRTFVNADDDTVNRHVNLMDDWELREAANADALRLRDLARLQTGYTYDAEKGYDVNPFWYNPHGVGAV